MFGSVGALDDQSPVREPVLTRSPAVGSAELRADLGEQINGALDVLLSTDQTYLHDAGPRRRHALDGHGLAAIRPRSSAASISACIFA